MKLPWLPGPCAAALIAAAPVFAADPLKWETKPGYRTAAVSPSLPGKTGFTLLDSRQTGIQFTNVLTIGTAAANQNLLQGAGVAAADFDGDGWCDLYFCNVEGGNALYRNLGDFHFEDVTAKAGVAAPPGMFTTGANFADVSGDGWPDLVLAGNNTVALFMNEGNGHFTNATAASGLITKPLGATSIALGDLNGDGALDLFIGNYGEITILRTGGQISTRMVGGKPVVSGRYARRWKIVDGALVELGEVSAVYLNDGGGHFKPLSWTDGTFLDEDGRPLQEAPLDLTLSVLIRDVNGDGAPDIYMCNDFQTPDRLWLNDGHARFRAAPRLALRSTSHFSMGVDFADVDRDGRDDCITVDMLSRHHALRMTQAVETNLAPNGPGLIENRPQIRQNVFFWNRGDGTYAQIACFAGLEASDWSWTPAFIDVDLDGYEDLLVSNGHAFDTQDLDMSMTPIDRRDRSPATAVKHLLSFPKLETPNLAFRNRRDLTFEEVGATWGFNSKQVCHGIVFADIDNDGDLDAMVSSLNAPPLIYRNDSPAPRVQVRLKGKAPNTRGIGAKVELFGGAVPVQSQQIVSGGRYMSADQPIRVFAAGTLTNRMRVEVTWRNGTRSVVGDVAANRIYEVDEAGAQPKTAESKAPGASPVLRDVSSFLEHQHHEESFDDFSRQPLLTKKMSQLGPGVAWMDFDGDGRDELVVGTGRNGSMAILRSDGKSGFVKTELPNIASDDLLGLAPWVSRDGKRSLLVARANYEAGGSPALLKISASAGTSMVASQALPMTSSPGPLAAAEIDGSGALELFVGGRVAPGRFPEPVTSLLLTEDKGGFVPDPRNAEILRNIGLVSGAVWSDLNEDGFPELILACEWGPIRVFRNDHGTLREATKELKLDRLAGWWSSVTTGDIDGDGRLDIIAGNWGLNSWFHASEQNPLRLYYGDFAGDGGVRLIEARFDSEMGKIVPMENLTLLAPVLPYLRGKFPTYASFRSASVQDALGDRLSAGKEVVATTLASILLLNRGDHFDVVSVPAQAQWAPVFGICVADIDGDGADDVFLAQNCFAMRKEIPRIDAGMGLWLRNDGRGDLRPMSAADSGVAVWGEQRGCAVADFDGDGRVDLAVSQNGAATKLFHNERAKPGLRVRLKGSAGNPDGIGSILRLKYGDRLGPAREIHGASGYLSVDGAVAVLGMRAPPTSVVVRWPGGKSSEQPVAAGAQGVVVEFPK